MSSYVGIQPNNPRKYLGPRNVIVSVVTRDREPLSTDIKDGATGKYYPIGSYWIIGASPSTGTEGDLWYLSKIVSNAAYWIQLSTNVTSVVDIDTPDGNTVVTSANTITFANGTGMNITGSGSTVTFNSVGGGFTWVAVTGTSQAISAGYGYSANNSGLITFTLPATANFGDRFIISGYGAGGWTIAQNAGQSIILGPSTSTIGVGGSVSSILPTDTIFVVCVLADTVFKALDWQGSLTVV